MACYEIIDHEHAESLLGFHILIICNYIGRFQGKSKESCTKLFFKDDSEAHAALQQLTLGLEKFVCNLYCYNRPSNMDSVGKLCSYLRGTIQKVPEKVPSTSTTLESMINSVKDLIPIVIPLTLYSCKAGCKTNQWKWFQSFLHCTDACHCQKCTNHSYDYEMYISIHIFNLFGNKLIRSMAYLNYTAGFVA